MQIIKKVGKIKKIKITVVDRLGKKGCHRGMKVGMTFDYEKDRGLMCPMAAHIAFVYADILKYGGNFGGETPYKTRFCCSDPDTVIVYSIEIVE